jgi:hypothetical protein
MWNVALAVAFVAAGSVAVDLETVDPHTALVEWSDGVTEEIQAQNSAYCTAIESDIRSGRWKPAGRGAATLVTVVCRRGGPYTGGSCIRGYQGPRAEGYCK